MTQQKRSSGHLVAGVQLAVHAVGTGWNGVTVRTVDSDLIGGIEQMKFKKIILIFAITLIALIAHKEANSTTIIGDSHVGGLKPYLIRHMQVKYRNGSTADYWLKHPVHDSTLIVMTGTNDRIAGKSSSRWLKQTETICRQAKRCWIVSPPNVQFAYRTVLEDRSDVIWACSYRTRDGVHLYQAGYRSLARKIIEAVK